MSQDTTKPKTLTIGKPLSLTKQAEIANTMEITKGIISPTKSKPKSQDKSSTKDQTLPSSYKDKQKERKFSTTDQTQGSPQKDVPTEKKSKLPVDAVNALDEKETNQAALDKIAKREALKQRFARIKEALAWLCEMYPNCFNLKDPKPLKIGITKDILAAMSSEPTDHPSILSIRQAIHHYTCNMLYHQAMLSNAHRIDLEGQTADEITDQARTHAQGWIEVKELAKQRWQEKQKQRKNPTHQTKLDNTSFQDSDSPSVNSQIEVLS